MSRYLVTGATSGLGAVVADALEATGAEVLRMTRRHADFGNAAAVQNAMAGLIGGGGPIDGIFHAAGTALIKPLRMTTPEDLGSVMIAFTSAFGLLRCAASKGMLKDAGSIVLMSSVAAHRGTAGMAAYSASKGAIEAMARAAAVELAPRRIRVNCVAAGAFDSPMHAAITRTLPDAVRIAYEGKHPLGLGTVYAVRDEVLHLLGPASRWTTGTTVVVDGGYLAG